MIYYHLSLLICANALTPKGKVTQTQPNKTFKSSHYTFVPGENIYKFTKNSDIPVRDVNPGKTCQKADGNVCVSYNVRDLGEDTHDVVLVRDLGNQNTYEVFPDTRQKVRDDLKCMLKVCFKVPRDAISQYRILGEGKLGQCWVSKPMKTSCCSKERVRKEPPKLACFMGQCMDTSCCKPRNAQVLPKYKKTPTHVLAEKIMAAQKMPAKTKCCSKRTTGVLQKPPKLSCFMRQCEDKQCCVQNEKVPSKNATHELAEKIFLAQQLPMVCHSTLFGELCGVLSSIPEDFRETNKPEKQAEIAHIFNVGQMPQPTWRLVLVWMFWCFKISLFYLLVRMCCCRSKVVVVHTHDSYDLSYPGTANNNHDDIPRESGPHGYGAYVYGAQCESGRTSNERHSW